MRHPRLTIVTEFREGGLRYVVGAIVRVTEKTARQWIEAGRAKLYPDEPPLDPAPSPATPHEPPAPTA